MAGHARTTVPVGHLRAAKLVKGFKTLQEAPSPLAESEVPAQRNRGSSTSSCLPRPCSCAVSDTHTAAALASLSFYSALPRYKRDLQNRQVCKVTSAGNTLGANALTVHQLSDTEGFPLYPLITSL